MPSLSKFTGAFAAFAVILLQRSGVCWAAETTAQGVSGTLYGGAGTLTVPNNESGADEYQVGRMGVGVLGVLRPGAFRGGGAEPSKLGFFAVLGGTFELESSRQTVCNWDCYPTDEEHYLAKHFAGRLGLGYSFELFEFRVGALLAVPDSHVSYAMPLLMPDALARIGPRDLGWFELGLGAYSPSTNLRPGAYLGGALGPERVVQISAHVGLHFVNGLCCNTVIMAGYAGELSATHRFSNSLTGSVGATLFAAERYSDTLYVAEGSARVAFAF